MIVKSSFYNYILDYFPEIILCGNNNKTENLRKVELLTFILSYYPSKSFFCYESISIGIVDDKVSIKFNNDNILSNMISFSCHSQRKKLSHNLHNLLNNPEIELLMVIFYLYEIMKHNPNVITRFITGLYSIDINHIQRLFDTLKFAGLIPKLAHSVYDK